MDPQEEQPDAHAAARERRSTKDRRGMQVSGRSTKTVLPGQIARRGHEAEQWLHRHQPHGRRAEDDDTDE
jgi:hypothetical protein